MTTVNASYYVQITPEELAKNIVKKNKNKKYFCSVVAFFTEVSLKLQVEFIKEMKISMKKIKEVALYFYEKFGYEFKILDYEV